MELTEESLLHGILFRFGKADEGNRILGIHAEFMQRIIRADGEVVMASMAPAVEVSLSDVVGLLAPVDLAALKAAVAAAKG